MTTRSMAATPEAADSSEETPVSVRASFLKLSTPIEFRFTMNDLRVLLDSLAGRPSLDYDDEECRKRLIELLREQFDFQLRPWGGHWQ